MTMTNCDDTWKLMKEYKFEVDPDSINDDLSCIICQDLMVDACRSVCGCQFCHKCITDYVGDGRRYCPGNKTKCKEEYLSLENDLIKDKRMNNKIFRSRVLCPNDSCHVKIELAQMNEHLRVCSKLSMECPYVTIGCDYGEQAKDSILVHLNKEMLPHAQISLDYIHNLKNEVDGMKSNYEKSKSEILALKEDSKMKDMKIEETLRVVMLLKKESNEEIADLRTEMESAKEASKMKDMKMEEIIQEMTISRKELNEQMEKLRNEINLTKEDSNEQIKNLKKEMESSKEECTQKDNRIATLGEQLNEIRSEMESILFSMIDERAKMNEETEERINGRMKAQNKEINDRLNEQKTEIDLLKVVKSKKEIINERESRMYDWIKSCPNIDADFIWKIDEYSKKRETMKTKYFHSESFYTKNYKLCLCLFMHSDNIWLDCAIMKGDNDDNVRWPMTLKVTLGIINQYTLETQNSVVLQYDTYKYDKSAFNQPMSDRNDCISSNEFIKYSSIKDNRSIIVNDSILISCIVSDR